MTTPISYETFELLIGERTEEGYSVRILDSPHGQAKGILQLDDDALEELTDALAVIEERETDADTLAQIGDFLFDALFADDILTLYRQSLAVVHGQEGRLRVRLHIEPPKLAALPWEFLHDAGTSSFPAIAPETALMRFIPMKLPVRATAIELPLRILVVIANPEGVVPLDVAQETRILQEALQPQIDAGRIQLQVIDKARIETINQAMRSYEPHIFHFVGHGLFDGDQAYVVLEDDNGMAKPVDETVFREIFAASKETRLAVLNACQTATVSSTRPLAGLAPNLLQRKLSGVIAMQYTVADKAALIFARDLYRSLALGLPLEAAVSEARKAIYMEWGPDMPDWGTPVLFLRAKDGQLFNVAEPAAPPPALQIPPPPPPMTPPVAEGFVGRDAELAYFSAKLAESNLAVVAGMPGVGKTAVAAQLAVNAGQPDKTFWHSFRSGEGVDVLIWKMAAFLAFNGQHAPWQMLQSTLLSGGQLPPPDVLFDYLFQAIRGQGYLICLDDFQRVEADPLLEKLVDRLRPAVAEGSLRLILATQKVPSFVQSSQFQRLGGLGEIDTDHLLRHNGVHLPEVQRASLHKYTGGNAELLVLAANSLRTAADPEEMLGRLTNSADVERFLLSEVDGTLDDDERLVMNGVAVLLGMPGTQDIIEEVLDGPSVRRTLSFLANRYLLESQDSPHERAYVQHAVVQSFYYGLLSRRERRAMHQRAAAFYEFEEMNDLWAARHYLRAGEDKRSAQVLLRDLTQHLNSGYLHSLDQTLEEYQDRRFRDAPDLWGRILVARGMVQNATGRSEAAQKVLREAEAILSALPPDPEIQTARAHLCREMVVYLRYKAPQEAMSWIDKGIALVGNTNPTVEAALLTQASIVHRIAGEAAQSMTLLHQALSLLRPSDQFQRMIVYINLGFNHFLRNDVAEGIDYTRQALEIAGQINAHTNELTALSNLAAFQYIAGAWQSAAENYGIAIDAARRLGNRQEEARIRANLGVLCLYRGDFATAEQHLSTGLILSEQHDWPEIRLMCALYLAELLVLERDIARSDSLIDVADALIERTGISYQTPLRQSIQAELSLLQDQSEQAQEWAEAAIASARSQEMRHEEGMGLRVLADALVAQDKIEAGLEAYAQSSLLLTDNPFEAAITKLHWAQSLIKMGDDNIAIPMLEEAEQAFANLGARYYLEQVLALLD